MPGNMHRTTALPPVLFMGLLIMLIALAGLAQTRTTDQVGTKPRRSPLFHGDSARSRLGQGRDAKGTQIRALDSEKPLFLPTTAYNSGGENAVAVAIADVNGDTKQDLVVLNECGNDACSKSSLGILRGKGDGTFGGVTTYRTVGSFGVAMAVADLNDDGKPDVVVANFFSSGVSVLRGNGNATFGPGTAYGSGGIWAQSIAIADLNDDGKPDLVVGNAAGNFINGNPSTKSVSILQGNGDGTFQTAAAYESGGTDVSSLAIADLNGDGLPDLVAVVGCVSGNCANGGAVAVLMGEGGTFQAPVIYKSGSDDPGSVAVGDANGDGKPDLLVANGSGSVGVLLGNGDGTFQPAVTYPSAGSSIKLGDLNGDGRLDVLLTGGASVFVLLGNGDGSFQTPLIFDSGGQFASSIALGDLDGDGKEDVVSANQVSCNSCGRGSLGVLLANTGATKTIVTTSATPSFVGQTITLAATVIPKFGVIPDGELVTFLDGGENLAAVPLVAGKATYAISSLTPKTHHIKAVYAGDGSFEPSAGSVTQIVVKYPTATALRSSPNPSIHDQPVAFVATVMTTGPLAPTGRVKFMDTGLVLGSATLSSGTATLSYSKLLVGRHTITAEYLGDGISKSSTSSRLNQVVK